MARTIAEIQAQIIATVQADSTLGSQLTSTSVTAIWRLWTYVVAVALWLHESIWETFRSDLLEELANQKPHTLAWYRTKALVYQHGGTLNEGVDTYNNTGLTTAQIEAMKIVKYASSTEGTDGKVVIKVAKDVAGVVTPLSLSEQAGVFAYFGQIKDAGVALIVRSVPPDRLKLTVDCYYNASILNANGGRLDGSSTMPLVDAVNASLKSLKFDGRFVKASLTDAMQQVEGVIVPEIRVCQARRDDDPTFANVDVFYTCYSGFIKIEPVDLVINYIAA